MSFTDSTIAIALAATATPAPAALATPAPTTPALNAHYLMHYVQRTDIKQVTYLKDFPYEPFFKQEATNKNMFIHNGTPVVITNHTVINGYVSILNSITNVSGWIKVQHLTLQPPKKCKADTKHTAVQNPNLNITYKSKKVLFKDDEKEDVYVSNNKFTLLETFE
jgi:hypothetical protein